MGARRRAGLPTPAAASDPREGTDSGREDSHRWRATIARTLQGAHALHDSVSSHMPACSGDADARPSDDRLMVDGDGCSLAITRREEGRDQDRGQCPMWHGAACGFDSDLARN